MITNVLPRFFGSQCSLLFGLENAYSHL